MTLTLHKATEQLQPPKILISFSDVSCKIISYHHFLPKIVQQHATIILPHENTS